MAYGISESQLILGGKDTISLFGLSHLISENRVGWRGGGSAGGGGTPHTERTKRRV